MLLALSAVAGCGGGASSTSSISTTASQRWIAAWADAQGNAAVSSSDPASNEQTFRVIVKPSVGSQKTIRVAFSNEFGTQPITIGAARVAVRTTGAAVDPTRDVPLTFAGISSVTLAPGSSIASDPAALAFGYGTVLAITEYVSGSWPALTESDQSLGIITNYATPPGTGNRTTDTTGSAFSQTSQLTFLVDRVDVYGDYLKTVAVIGSSTTAGYGADLDGFDTWPDDLADALHRAGHNDISVVDLALSPDALVDSDAGTYPSIVSRFARDAISLPGIADVIQYGGDIELKSACDPATVVIAGDQNLIQQAHAAGIRLLLAKIAPETYCKTQSPGAGAMFPANTGQDAERVALDAWMSSTAPSTVDGSVVQPPSADAVLDFSTPVSDPANTGYLTPGLSLDGAHLTAAGQALQAAAIPLGDL